MSKKIHLSKYLGAMSFTAKKKKKKFFNSLYSYEVLRSSPGPDQKCSYSNFSLICFSDNGFIADSLLEDVMKALDLVSDPE